MTDGLLTHDEWIASMAHNTASASLVIHDEEHRLLLLHPTYQEQWQFPGGVVGHGEDPLEAALRETEEEVGQRFSCEPQLLGVDWYRPEGLTPYAQFFFKGPRVVSENFEVTLSVEHDAWEWRSVEAWRPLVGPQQAGLLAYVQAALITGRPFYLHEGGPARAGGE
uniref:NUDIX domain-containing protein n=1 Tax=Streptomyces sp. CA-136453 TaxID=3240050 RepID=UPI003F4936C2